MKKHLCIIMAIMLLIVTMMNLTGCSKGVEIEYTIEGDNTFIDGIGYTSMDKNRHELDKFTNSHDLMDYFRSKGVSTVNISNLDKYDTEYFKNYSLLILRHTHYSGEKYTITKVSVKKNQLYVTAKWSYVERNTCSFSYRFITVRNEDIEGVTVFSVSESSSSINMTDDDF